MRGNPSAAGEPSSTGEVPRAPRVSVVLPTRDEARNLTRLKHELEAALAGVSYEVIVVDDSTDRETRPLLRSISAQSERWRVIEREPGRQTGLATAVAEGMGLASGEFLCVMDADLQHPPALVPQLVAAVEGGADMAVASRYTRGGGSDGLADVYRHLVSGCSRLTAHLVFPESRRTTDPLSGFFCLRRRSLTGVDPRPVGFKILLELLVLLPQLKVVDVPFVFGPRAAGESKASARQGLLYIRHLTSLFVRVPQSALRLKLALISACSLLGFMIGFDVLRLFVGQLALAWIVAALASLAISGALQGTIRAGGSRRGLRRSVGLGALVGGVWLYPELLQLEPGNPVGTGVLLEAAVLALPLGVSLVAVGPPSARGLSLAGPWGMPDGRGHPAWREGVTAAALRVDGCVSCSVGIMAHNEAANIARTLRAVLAQDTPRVHVEEVIVVASGCTDGTDTAVAGVARTEPRVRLCLQERREGKASAINLFLKQASSPIVVLSGADVIPQTSALENLCVPFEDSQVGMVGGRPVPVNDPYTFMGHAVHLLWRLHDYLARVQPKLGEVVAFRNVISGIPTDTAVDEISIQALISQLGYRLVYQPACVVYNKGPLTVQDFVKQRRRIYAGHLQVRKQQRYDAPTMRVTPIVRQLIACRHFALSSPRRAVWTLGTVLLEAFARLQGYRDYRLKHAHNIWQMVESTKDLETDKLKARGLCSDQSVLVFRLIPQGPQIFDIYPESSDRQATEAARKVLPLVRARIRREDKLTISGPGVLTAVIRVEQAEAELVARDIQEAVQATPVHVGIRGRELRVAVAYSVLTFGLRPEQEGVTVNGRAIRPPVQQDTADVIA